MKTKQLIAPPDLFGPPNNNSIVKEAEQVIPLRKLAEEVKLGLKRAHPDSYWVEGEVTDFKYSFVKNYYSFKLVDKDPETGSIVAGFPATIWSKDTILVDKFKQKTGFEFNNRLKIHCQCRVSFHSVYGLSLQITDINPEYSIGNIELARQQVLSRLTMTVKGIYLKDGEYFTPNKLLKLPKIIRRVALITSAGSQGHQDFLHEINNSPNGYRYSVITYPANVGKDGAARITALLKNVIHSRQCDVIVLTRAGGNEIDLLAFDDFALNKEVALCPIPIISGIGHEQNKSICDQLSTVTVKTPTKAAAFIEEQNLLNATRLYALFPEITLHVNSLLNTERSKLTTLLQRVGSHATKLIDSKLGLVSGMINDIRLQSVNLFYKTQQHILEMQRQVDLQDPQPSMDRGFALVHNDKGEVITSPSQVDVGDNLQIKVKEGIINVNVSQSHGN